MPAQPSHRPAGRRRRSAGRPERSRRRCRRLSDMVALLFTSSQAPRFGAESWISSFVCRCRREWTNRRGEARQARTRAGSAQPWLGFPHHRLLPRGPTPRPAQQRPQSVVFPSSSSSTFHPIRAGAVARQRRVVPPRSAAARSMSILLTSSSRRSRQSDSSSLSAHCRRQNAWFVAPYPLDLLGAFAIELVLGGLVSIRKRLLDVVDQTLLEQWRTMPELPGGSTSSTFALISFCGGQRSRRHRRPAPTQPIQERGRMEPTIAPPTARLLGSTTSLALSFVDFHRLSRLTSASPSTVMTSSRASCLMSSPILLGSARIGIGRDVQALILPPSVGERDERSSAPYSRSAHSLQELWARMRRIPRPDGMNSTSSSKTAPLDAASTPRVWRRVIPGRGLPGVSTECSRKLTSTARSIASLRDEAPSLR